MASRLNILKQLRQKVSQNRNRFVDENDGVDLDLTYITNNIIAMGFPATGLEATYRNPRARVVNFLDSRHGKEHYRVVNLCAEKSHQYDPSVFHGNLMSFPIFDHNPCPLFMIADFCLQTEAFLKEDEKNVVAVHCKAGKGRTGFMVSCLLLHLGVDPTARHAVAHFTAKRCFEGTALNQPSQKRYVDYWEAITRASKKIVKTPTGYRMKKVPKRVNKIYSARVKSRPFGMSIMPVGRRLQVWEVKGQAREAGIRVGDMLVAVDGDVVTPDTWLEALGSAQPPFKITLKRKQRRKSRRGLKVPKLRSKTHSRPHSASGHRRGVSVPPTEKRINSHSMKPSSAKKARTTARRVGSPPPTGLVRKLSKKFGATSLLNVMPSNRLKVKSTSSSLFDKPRVSQSAKFVQKVRSAESKVIKIRNTRSSAPDREAIEAVRRTGKMAVLNLEKDVKILGPADRDWQEFVINEKMLAGFKAAFQIHQETFPESIRESIKLLCSSAVGEEDIEDLNSLEPPEAEDDEDEDDDSEISFTWEAPDEGEDWDGGEGEGEWSFRPSLVSIDQEDLDGFDDLMSEPLDRDTLSPPPVNLGSPGPGTPPPMPLSGKREMVDVKVVDVDSGRVSEHRASSVAAITKVPIEPPTSTTLGNKQALWLPDEQRGSLRLSSIILSNASKDFNQLRFFIYVGGVQLLQRDTLMSDKGNFVAPIAADVKGDVSVVATALRRADRKTPTVKGKPDKPILRFWFHTALVDRIKLVAMKADVDIANREAPGSGLFNSKTKLTLSFTFSKQELKNMRHQPSRRDLLASANAANIKARVFRRDVVLRVYSKLQIKAISQKIAARLEKMQSSAWSLFSNASTGNKFLNIEQKEEQLRKLKARMIKKRVHAETADILSVRAESETLTIPPPEVRRKRSIWSAMKKKERKVKAMYKLTVGTQSRIWQLKKSLKAILSLYDILSKKFPNHFSMMGTKTEDFPQCLLDVQANKLELTSIETRIDAITQFLELAVKLRIKQGLEFLRDESYSLDRLRKLPPIKIIEKKSTHRFPRTTRRATVSSGSLGHDLYDTKKCQARGCKRECKQFLRYCVEHFEEYFGVTHIIEVGEDSSDANLRQARVRMASIDSLGSIITHSKMQNLMLIQLGLLDVDHSVATSSGVCQYILRCLLSEHEFLAWSTNLQLAMDWESPDPMLQLLLQAIRSSRRLKCTCPRSCKNFQIRLALVSRMLDVFDDALTSKVDLRRCLTLRMRWALLDGVLRLPPCSRFNALGDTRFEAQYVFSMINKAASAGNTRPFFETILAFAFENPPPPELPGTITSPSIIPLLLRCAQTASIGLKTYVLEKLAESVDQKNRPHTTNAQRLVRLTVFASELAYIIATLPPFDAKRLSTTRIVNLGTGKGAESVGAARKLLANLLSGGFGCFEISTFAPQVWHSFSSKFGWSKRLKNFTKSAVSMYLEICISKLSKGFTPDDSTRTNKPEYQAGQPTPAVPGKISILPALHSCLEAIALVLDLVLFYDFAVKVVDAKSFASPRARKSKSRLDLRSADDSHILKRTSTGSEPVLDGVSKSIRATRMRLEKSRRLRRSLSSASVVLWTNGAQGGPRPSFSLKGNVLLDSSSSNVDMRLLLLVRKLAQKFMKSSEFKQTTVDAPRRSKLLKGASNMLGEISSMLKKKRNDSRGVGRLLRKSRYKKILSSLSNELKLDTPCNNEGMVERIVSFKDKSFVANTVRYYISTENFSFRVNPGVAYSKNQCVEVNLVRSRVRIFDASYALHHYGPHEKVLTSQTEDVKDIRFASEVASDRERGRVKASDGKFLYALEVSTESETYVFGFRGQNLRDFWKREILLAREFQQTMGIRLNFKRNAGVEDNLDPLRGLPVPVGPRCHECKSGFSMFLPSKVQCSSCGREFCKKCCVERASGGIFGGSQSSRGELSPKTSTETRRRRTVGIAPINEKSEHKRSSSSMAAGNTRSSSVISRGSGMSPSRRSSSNLRICTKCAQTLQERAEEKVLGLSRLMNLSSKDDTKLSSLAVKGSSQGADLRAKSYDPAYLG
eukprot:CAMPEP_0167742728 /NCGR_PEP_ID=MMETSP0110_2-20121227/1601_1 /TAXON_ID=629695 /ORGANISM="Gymnochlora sp., Strain CCMP2014" /LENGTH=2041 /DNA_ID=CAMNT_0007626979 /DNA_START=27 /DNA_END=6152 /DNA_ORIENTATION=+